MATSSMPVPSRSAPVRLYGCTVQVVAGPDKGKRASVLQGALKVGTDGGNDLVLSDSTVSRQHLELLVSPEGLLLRDLGSRNGCLLSGRKVREAFLVSGDQLTLGKTRVTVRQDKSPTEVLVAEGESFGELCGSSVPIRAAFETLRRLAADGAPVIIEGETGTGKELAARALHAHSSAKLGPFRIVDCHGAAAELVEKELRQEGGTLVFDELSELPLNVQRRLSRELDLKDAARPRLVALTTRNLAAEVEAKRFREDLRAAFAGSVRLPPLRARKEDLPLLCRALLASAGRQLPLSTDFLGVLKSHHWPGNVRELRNVLERTAVLHGDENASGIRAALLPGDKRKGSSRNVVELPYHEARDRVLLDFERDYLEGVMKRAGFDFAAAESMTGLSMQSLYRLLKKNGLSVKALKGPPAAE